MHDELFTFLEGLASELEKNGRPILADTLRSNFARGTGGADLSMITTILVRTISS